MKFMKVVVEKNPFGLIHLLTNFTMKISSENFEIEDFNTEDMPMKGDTITILQNMSIR